MKNWQGIPTTCLTLGGEVMVHWRSALNSSTTYLLLPLKRKVGTIKYLMVDPVVSCLQH